MPEPGPASLRILIIAHGHPELSAGGAEQAAYLLFLGLKEVEGHKPFFLAWAEDAADGRDSPRIECFRGRPDEFLLFANDFDRFLLSQSAPSAIEKLALLLGQIDPHVVHFHHYLNIGVEFIGVARRFKPNIRIIVTLHEYLAICHHYGLMVKTDGLALCKAATDSDCAACFKQMPAADFARRRLRLRHYFDQVDVFISPSRFLRRRYIAWGIQARRIVVLENGIEPVQPLPSRARRAGEGRGVFGFFGQIHPFKGVHCLLSAFDRLSGFPAEITAALQLIINGAYLELNGPDYIASFNSLLAKTRAWVRFAGPYEHRDLTSLMAAVDWVVVPSVWWENSPIVIQEAFACRRPVLCSDIGGMREKVRSGKDGFRFPVGDADALTRLMLRLAADDRIWDRLQSTIRQPVTVKESVANHLELYHAPSSSAG